MRISAFLMITLFILLNSGCSSYYPKYGEKLLLVVEPYIELRKEADDKSIVFYVAEKDEQIRIIGNYNQFFKIELPQGQQGWVAEADILKTVGIMGDPVKGVKYGIIQF